MLHNKLLTVCLGRVINGSDVTPAGAQHRCCQLLAFGVPVVPSSLPQLIRKDQIHSNSSSQTGIAVSLAQHHLVSAICQCITSGTKAGKCYFDLFCMRFSITCVYISAKLMRDVEGQVQHPIRIPFGSHRTSLFCQKVCLLRSSAPSSGSSKGANFSHACDGRTRPPDNKNWELDGSDGWDRSHPDLWILWIENLATACSYCLLYLVACSILLLLRCPVHNQQRSVGYLGHLLEKCLNYLKPKSHAALLEGLHRTWMIISPWLEFVSSLEWIMFVAQHPSRWPNLY
jgi:hypothetical protein